MYSKVIKVEPMPDYTLHLIFDDGKNGKFDMKPYLDTGMFKQLRNEGVFKTVHINFDSVEWNNGVDICPEVLYNGVKNLE